MARHSAAPHAAAELPNACRHPRRLPGEPGSRLLQTSDPKIKVGFSHACAAAIRPAHRAHPSSSDHRPPIGGRWGSWNLMQQLVRCLLMKLPMQARLSNARARIDHSTRATGCHAQGKGLATGFSQRACISPEGSFLTGAWAGIPMPVLRPPSSVPLKPHLVWITRASRSRHWAPRADGIIGMGSLSFLEFTNSPETAKKLINCLLSDGDSGPGPFLEFRNPLNKQRPPRSCASQVPILPPPPSCSSCFRVCLCRTACSLHVY